MKYRALLRGRLLGVTMGTKAAASLGIRHRRMEGRGLHAVPTGTHPSSLVLCFLCVLMSLSEYASLPVEDLLGGARRSAHPTGSLTWGLEAALHLEPPPASSREGDLSRHDHRPVAAPAFLPPA